MLGIMFSFVYFILSSKIQIVSFNESSMLATPTVTTAVIVLIKIEAIYSMVSTTLQFLESMDVANLSCF